MNSSAVPGVCSCVMYKCRLSRKIAFVLLEFVSLSMGGMLQITFKPEQSRCQGERGGGFAASGGKYLPFYRTTVSPRSMDMSIHQLSALLNWRSLGDVFSIVYQLFDRLTQEPHPGNEQLIMVERLWSFLRNTVSKWVWKNGGWVSG